MKICAINGYRVAVDSQSFTVAIPSSHAFCHKSYIPRDLGDGWAKQDTTKAAGVNGWCSNWITMDTYRGSGANVSSGSSFTVTNTGSATSATGTLLCNNGTWKIGSGSMTITHDESSGRTFCFPYGAKSAGKSITFELWGAQGGGDDNGGKGGYTKGVIASGKYSDGETYYLVTGGQGNTVTTTSNGTGGYNGGGISVRTYCAGYSYFAHGGGGATHVATASGLLSSLSGNKSTVLLVAGGGGGGYNYISSATYKYNISDGGSGGGGYYGGGGYCGGWAAAGGGGSGYCNTSKFICSGSNGQRSGSGYIKISW